MYAKLLTNLVHGLDASNRFEGNTGLELTAEMLTRCFAHNLLLFKAGYHPNSLSGNWGPLYPFTVFTYFYCSYILEMSPLEYLKALRLLH
jgi:hypothetical protein